MSLLRAVARPMLASYFVVSGIKAIRNPQALVAEAEPVADKLVPVIKRVAPDEISGRIPEDTATLVRIDGVVQVVGGLALATGKGRRVGALLLAASLIPATWARHPFWSRSDAEEKAADRAHFLKNVSLLGGVLLASADTEGKPSLVWRAQAGTDRAARKTRKAGKKAKRALTGSSSSVADTLGDAGKSLSKNTQHLAELATVGGVGLVHEVAKQSRRSRKKAAKQAKKSSKRAAELAAEARKIAEKQARRAAKKTKHLRKDVGKQVGELASVAQDQAKTLQKTAGKQAQSIAKDVSKNAGKLADNIHLGAN